MFLRNLILNENNELHNRSMHISWQFSNIKKVDIDDKKADIETILSNIKEKISSKTVDYVIKLYGSYGSNKIFGRSDIERVIGLKSTRTSELIKLMLDNDIIEPVQGYGKGKYRFK